MSKTEDLAKLRSQIETLDTDILRLLNKRTSVAIDIGRVKAQGGLDVYDRGREETVFSYLARNNHGPLETSQVWDVFQRVISVSRDLQRRVAGAEQNPRMCPDASPDVWNLGVPVSGHTALYCIIGNPVCQSMGPLMHTTAFRSLGLDAVYLAFKVQDVAAAIQGMKALGVKGASVTHPLKEHVISLLTELTEITDVDETARRIGAVNTLVFDTDVIRGTNTDWIGAVRCLETLTPIEGRTFAVLGAGGTARAVIYGITSKGGKAIVINRTEDKGLSLANEFGCTFVPLSKVQTVEADCLVNTTPVGMYPGVEDMPIPASIVSRFQAVADVIYNPLRTRLIKEAESLGCATATGFDMFVHQGAEQFAIWTGKPAPIERMRAVVYEKLERNQ